MWQLECIFSGSLPSARDNLTGSTDHWHSCAWTPATADNIAVGMWSKQLARIPSCLSPCHNMCLWSSSASKRSPQPFPHALCGQLYFVARLFYLLKSFPNRQFVRDWGPGALKTEELEFRGRETNSLSREQKLVLNEEWRFAGFTECRPHLWPRVESICRQMMVLGREGWRDSGLGLLPV